MTNQKAIQLINRKLPDGRSSKCEAVARVFASEDIIEMDINEWLKTPLKDLQNMFIDEAMNGTWSMVQQLIDKNNANDMEELVYEAVDKTVSVMRSMACYSDIYQTLQQESER